MKTQRRLVASALALGLSVLYGCSVDTSSDQPVPGYIPVPVNGVVAPKFDPINTAGGLSVIPIPNDILRDPATGLNTRIPPDPARPNDLTSPQNAIRTIRGFSTTGNIIIPFDGQIDAATVTPQSLLVVEGEGSKDPAGSTGTNATVACNITVLNGTGSGSAQASTVILQPKLPLKPLTNYYVVITQGIQASGRPIGQPHTGGAQDINTGLLTKSPNPLVDGQGNSLIFPVPSASAAQLEPLRQFYQSVWARAESITGNNRSEIPFAFRFGTQPLYATLASPFNPNVSDPQFNAPGLRARASLEVGTTPGVVTFVKPGSWFTNTNPTDNTAPIAGTGSNPAQTVQQFYQSAVLQGAPDGARFAGATFGNIDRIFQGRITVARYMSTPDPTVARFQGENLPLAGSKPFYTYPGGNTPRDGGGAPDVNGFSAPDMRVPFYVCLPNSGGLPVPCVIYQHGIDHDKRDMFLVADKLCAAGYGVIAIDLYLHGDLKPNPGGFNGIGPLPANVFPNGTGFYNPGNLLGTRDNFRQCISDLFYLSEDVIAGKTDLTGDGIPEFRTPQSAVPIVNGPGPSYVGHSLGGIVGVPFTAVTPFSSKAAFSGAGGRLADMLLYSENRGPALLTALQQQAGVVPGTDQFLQLFWIAQTILDDVDPLNYAAPTFLTQATGGFKPDLGTPLGQQRARVFLQEIEGDRTIPNGATRDLARAYSKLFSFSNDTGFRHVQPVIVAVESLIDVASGFMGSGYYQVTGGFGHEAILGLDGDTTQKVLQQIVTFLGSPASPTGGPINAIP